MSDKKSNLAKGRNSFDDDMIEFYKRALGDRLTPYLPKD